MKWTSKRANSRKERCLSHVSLFFDQFRWCVSSLKTETDLQTYILFGGLNEHKIISCIAVFKNNKKKCDKGLCLFTVGKTSLELELCPLKTLCNVRYCTNDQGCTERNVNYSEKPCSLKDSWPSESWFSSFLWGAHFIVAQAQCIQYTHAILQFYILSTDC